MSINHVTVSGNLTRDPEVRTTASGKPVMSLGIAVNDRRRNPETGEWEKGTRNGNGERQDQEDSRYD